MKFCSSDSQLQQARHRPAHKQGKIRMNTNIQPREGTCTQNPSLAPWKGSCEVMVRILLLWYQGKVLEQLSMACQEWNPAGFFLSCFPSISNTKENRVVSMVGLVCRVSSNPR